MKTQCSIWEEFSEVTGCIGSFSVQLFVNWCFPKTKEQIFKWFIARPTEHQLITSTHVISRKAKWSPTPAPLFMLWLILCSLFSLPLGSLLMLSPPFLIICNAPDRKWKCALPATGLWKLSVIQVNSETKPRALPLRIWQPFHVGTWKGWVLPEHRYTAKCNLLQADN